MDFTKHIQRFKNSHMKGMDSLYKIIKSNVAYLISNEITKPF